MATPAVRLLVFSHFEFFFGNRRPKALCARIHEPRGHAFVLVLQKHVALDKVTGLEGFVLENTEMAKVETAVRAQVDDAIYNFQRHGVSANQTSSNRLLSIVPKIIEARHASIVNVEARRVTSSTVKRERHLRV